MKKLRTWCRRVLAGLSLPLFLCSWMAQAGAAGPWMEKSLVTEGLVDSAGQLLAHDGSVLKDNGGNPLVPDCAFGPFHPIGPFKFFVQPGDAQKLLILHDGGGACWESNTCGSVLTPTPVYDPSIPENPLLLSIAGGVFSDPNVANAFDGWTKVFIPYCTADIGWGNRDTAYPMLAGPPLVIHHRGYANIRAAMRWVENQYASQSAPLKVAVAGMSAGGYAAPGVLLPEVKKLFPSNATRTYLISDSANGIVTDGFLAGAKASWGYDNTLPSYLLNAINGGASGLPVRFYYTLGTRFPTTRIGQFQNAYDLVESLFYNTMLYTGDPTKWQNPQYLLPTISSWSVQARLSVALTSLLPNYRFYTAAGSEHTILLNTPAEAHQPFCSDEYYGEASAQGLAFRLWVNDMINAPSLASAPNWRNAGCFPNCVAAPKPGCPQ